MLRPLGVEQHGRGRWPRHAPRSILGWPAKYLVPRSPRGQSTIGSASAPLAGGYAPQPRTSARQAGPARPATTSAPLTSNRGSGLLWLVRGPARARSDFLSRFGSDPPGSHRTPADAWKALP